MNPDKEQIKQLKQQLYQTPVVYEWEYTGGYGGKAGHIFRFFGSFITAWFLPILMYLITDMVIGDIDFWIFVAFGIIATLVARYLFFPDSHYHYHLTSNGIHYTEEQVIPESAYKVVRGIGWLGIPVCLIALFTIGPLAFAGAGAWALMSFVLTNFRSQIDHCYVLFSEHTIVFDVKDDWVIAFKSKDIKGLAYVLTVYADSIAQKEELLSQLQLLPNDIETVEIKRLNDRYKHPVYTQQSDEAAE